MQEYCGDVINFKTFSKSFKLKKRIPNAEENRAVFKDVHEPIFARADWEKIQQKRGKARKRKTSDGEKNMFSGLLVCADCGHNLWYHFNQKNPEIRYFSCSNYKGNRATAQPRIISGWTFWNRCYYRKSVGLLNLRAGMKMNLHRL